MKVAVIGGGLFGCTAAVYAARAGHDVHLFEAKPRLMQGATSACYYRLHRGYHYPRSPETGRESLAAEASFRAEYGDCVIDGGKQLYAIPQDGSSKVTVGDFERFMDDMGLPYLISNLGGFEWTYSVNEPRIDAVALNRLVINRVENEPITVHGAWTKDTGFDQIVVAAYAGTNAVLDTLGCQKQLYRFQVVEKPLVVLPKEFRGTSIVVMDQCCIDPHQYSEYHALGHVSATIRAQNTGYEARVPYLLAPLIERGVVPHTEAWDYSAIGDVVARIAKHVPAVMDCEYIGSMFTVRAVLADQDATDARPTMVERLNDNVVRIFSGKLGTAVMAAKQAVSMLGGSMPVRYEDDITEEQARRIDELVKSEFATGKWETVEAEC